MKWSFKSGRLCWLSPSDFLRGYIDVMLPWQHREFHSSQSAPSQEDKTIDT
jgi:hypothetical protein